METQDTEITHLLTQVATGFEGWPSNILDEFIVRIRAVVADEKRKNTNSARKKENIRLQWAGRLMPS